MLVAIKKFKESDDNEYVRNLKQCYRVMMHQSGICDNFFAELLINLYCL
jgi:hypothetical protein